MKLLVVGFGSAGKRHLKNLQSLGVEDLGVVEVRADRRHEAREKFKIKSVYESLEDAFRDSYDAVVIAVPTSYHLRVSARSVDGAAHVLVEKPIADRKEGLENLLERARSKNLVFMVGHSYRFWKSLQRVAELLKNQAVGQIYSVQITISEYLPDWHPWEDYRDWFMAKKEEGGGAILDESHALDLVRWLFGEVESVYCLNGKFSSMDITSDDLADIILRFRNGIVGNIHLDIFSRDHRKELVIIGEKGNIFWDGNKDLVTVYNAESSDREMIRFDCDRNDQFLHEVKHFLECIEKGQSPVVDGFDGLKTLEVILAALESSEKGKVIKISGSDLPPRTSPPSKLDSEPFEVPCTG